MSSQITISPDPAVCKDKTCPVCGKSTVFKSGDPGMVTYTCNNRDCVVKNCPEPWFLHLSSRKGIGEMLMLAAEYEELSEFGRRGNRTEINKTKDCAEKIMLFHYEIENGILQKMDEAGYPCSGLGENVLGSIGITSINRKLESALRFIYFDGNGVSAVETCTKKLRSVSGKPGSFPLKTPGAEPIVYVFPSPKEVLIARNLWKNASLGEFPAYSFTSFPLPGTFAKTRKIVFVNVNGKLAAPEILSSAMRFHREGVSISGNIKLDINGLRSIFVSNPEVELYNLPKNMPNMELIGKTEKGEDIYFSTRGYFVLETGYSTPTEKTNFAFMPKRAIATSYPVSRKILTSDLYIDGNLEIRDIVIQPDKLNSINKMRILAETLAPGKKLHTDFSPFDNTRFQPPEHSWISFPFVPCVDRVPEIVFPKFRLRKEGFDPHPELERAMSDFRENFDYMALKPEQGTKADLAEFAKLMVSESESCKASTLGLCAWFHSAVSSLICMARNVQMPKLCFEIHCKSAETPPSMQFLSTLFSGNPEPCNNLEYRKCYKAKYRYACSTGKGAMFDPLPGLFLIDALDPSKSASSMYHKTASPGIYAVVNSSMMYPVNAHGNIQGAVIDNGHEPVVFNLPCIRRAILHILWKYVQTAEKINPDGWISKRPELSMYNLISASLKKFGITLPDIGRFDAIYIAKGRKP